MISSYDGGCDEIIFAVGSDARPASNVVSLESLEIVDRILLGISYDDSALLMFMQLLVLLDKGLLNLIDWKRSSLAGTVCGRSTS